MRVASHPVTALTVALGLAGLAAAGLLSNNRPLAVTLWAAAAVVALVSFGGLASRRGWKLRSPVLRPDPHQLAGAPSGSITATGLRGTEIEAMIWSLMGRFNDVPFSRGDILHLVGVLDSYRRGPWLPDPVIEVFLLPGDQNDEIEQSGLTIVAPSLPFSHYVVRCDGRRSTLERVKKVLGEDLIPRVKHWDAWHTAP
jgi:hypothetical protein